MNNKILSFDISGVGLSYSIVSVENNELILHKFGVIKFSNPPLSDLCKQPNFKFSFTDCELKFCCNGHKETFEGCKDFKNKTTGELTDYLNQKINETFETLDFDIILIEKQPEFRTIFFKKCQLILINYFKLLNKKTLSVQSNLKLYGKKFPNKKSGTKFRLSKIFSVECIKNLLNKDDFFKLKIYGGKIDDICDSINQAVAFIYKNKKLPEKILSLL